MQLRERENGGVDRVIKKSPLCQINVGNCGGFESKYFFSCFQRPVYEEPPFEQREKLHELERERLRENITDTSVAKDFDDDIPRFNALCRGEEFRVCTYRGYWYSGTIENSKEP